MYDAGSVAVCLSDLGAEMKLSMEDYGKLLSAGFTVRQITTMQEKFCNLLSSVPLPTPAHLQNSATLESELAAALAACKAKDEAIDLLYDSFVDYVEGGAEDEVMQIAKSARNLQPDDSALKAWLGEPVGEMHKAHAKSLDEKPWCKEILLYSAGSPFDLPEYRVTVYSPKELK